MIAIASHTQHPVVSMFEFSGVLLRPTANCTDACILQRSFQQAFGADGGKDEAPKCKYVLLEAVRLALTTSLLLLQQSLTCSAYIGTKMTPIARICISQKVTQSAPTACSRPHKTRIPWCSHGSGAKTPAKGCRATKIPLTDNAARHRPIVPLAASRGVTLRSRRPAPLLLFLIMRSRDRCALTMLLFFAQS